tara:strand:+ start:120 stop:521 length:402 start_codon:yes stop_codon:yes gene_type:complete
MPHFAQINENNEVVQVLVVGQEYVNTGLLGDPNKWIQTSYNTRAGKHYDSSTGLVDGGVPFRKNYAGIGYTYDKDRDAFIPPQPYPSWNLDEEMCIWICPVPHPNEGATEENKGTDRDYEWDEATLSWKDITQ